MDLTIITGLRFVHIFAGVFWAGSAFILAGFVEPAVRTIGPEGGKFMQALMQKTSMAVFLTLSAALNTLTGVILLWWASGGLQASWLFSTPGLSFTIGSLAGILAALLGALVNGPTAKRMAVVAGGLVLDGPGAATRLDEMKALEQRLTRASQLGALLLAITVVGMALARYL